MRRELIALNSNGVENFAGAGVISRLTLPVGVAAFITRRASNVSEFALPSLDEVHVIPLNRA